MKLNETLLFAYITIIGIMSAMIAYRLAETKVQVDNLTSFSTEVLRRLIDAQEKPVSIDGEEQINANEKQARQSSPIVLSERDKQIYDFIEENLSYPHRPEQSRAYRQRHIFTVGESLTVDLYVYESEELQPVLEINYDETWATVYFPNGQVRDVELNEENFFRTGGMIYKGGFEYTPEEWRLKLPEEYSAYAGESIVVLQDKQGKIAFASSRYLVVEEPTE